MIEPETLLRRTVRHFPQFERANIEITPIEKGGSGRRFYRIQFSPDNSIILVQYTREREENERFVEVARFLIGHRIRAPRIHFHDPTDGLIWMEDLGDRDLWSYREESWEVRRPLYASALANIGLLHCLPEEEIKAIEPHLATGFNETLYRWEQSYFFEHCLGGHFGVDASTRRNLAALPTLREIAARLARCPRVLVHRDFQSQNLIVRDGEAYLIDFQGMRAGLAQYDLASLLYDPYVSLTNEERDELIEYYLSQDPGFDCAFAEKLQLCAIQRLMQALGAYGYLGHLKAQPAFLTHIPAALKSLGRLVARVEGLDALQAQLQAL